MGNAFNIEPVRYHKRDAAGKIVASYWKVDIRGGIAGKRVRKFFDTKPEALDWIGDFQGDAKEFGVAEALDESAVTIAAAMSDFMEVKLASASPRYKQTLKLNETRIVDAFGPRHIASVSVRDVERWLAKKSWSLRTKRNALTSLRTFLEWCRRRDLVTRNVAGLYIAELPTATAKKDILLVEEISILLGLTKRYPLMRAFVVLGAFAGLRSAEIAKLDWSDVDHDEREIHVRPDVQKKTRGSYNERFVLMRPALLRLLPEHPKAGRVIPMRQNSFDERFQKFRARVKRVLDRVKHPARDRWSKWPPNCLRHSFASYLLAEKEDAGYVAHQLGHTSPKMVHAHYARAVRRAEAARYWALGTDHSNVVPFRKTA